MAKTLQQKKELIKYYEDLIDNSKGIIFTDNPGLKVTDVISLRKKLSEFDAQYHILKNKLFKLAVSKKYKEESKVISGTTAAIFSFGEITDAAKALKEFLKNLDLKLKIKGGILGNQYINDSQTKELANLPTKNGLFSKLVFTANYPLYSFANVLSGNIRNFVYVLAAITDQKK